MEENAWCLGPLTGWSRHGDSLFLVTGHCWALDTMSLVLGNSSQILSGGSRVARQWFPTWLFIRVIQELLKNMGSEDTPPTSQPSHNTFMFLNVLGWCWWAARGRNCQWRILFASSLTTRLFELRVFLPLPVTLTFQHLPLNWIVASCVSILCYLSFSLSFLLLPELAS